MSVRILKGGEKEGGGEEKEERKRLGQRAFCGGQDTNVEGWTWRFLFMQLEQKKKQEHFLQIFRNVPLTCNLF